MTKDLTRAELAQELDRSENTIWRWEKAGRVPKPKKLKCNGQVRYTPEHVALLRNYIEKGIDD